MHNSVNRFTIERHDELPESYKQAHRDSGVDPDTIWTLVWSFTSAAAAIECLNESVQDAGAHQTFRLVDQGISPAVTQAAIYAAANAYIL